MCCLFNFQCFQCLFSICNTTTAPQRYRHSRQKSAPSQRSRALSPDNRLDADSSHLRQSSEISSASSVFSTSLGDDTNWCNSDDIFSDNSPAEGRSCIESSEMNPKYTLKSIKRHASMRSGSTFANTFNRFSQSTASIQGDQQKNIIIDLLRSVAVDNHYKPRPLCSKTMNQTGKSRSTLTRSHSLKTPRNQAKYDLISSSTLRPRLPSDRAVGVRSSLLSPAERSPFDNMTGIHGRSSFMLCLASWLAV